MLDAVSQSANPLRILDAGCGIGTESLCFSYFGADVVGCDARSRVVRFADRRREFFSDQCGRSLACRFVHGSVFEALTDAEFDAVWIREAISHIHPLERFLEDLHGTMAAGGIVVIREHNSANRFVRSTLTRRLKQVDRELGSVYCYRDAESGREFEFADERPFSLESISRLLGDFGFEVRVAFGLGAIPKTLISRFFIFRPLRRFAYQWLWNAERRVGRRRVAWRWAKAMVVVAVRV
ncbi:MAG: class I SAM-dependent methyltransferase [Planctomycetes bacterium]|nr:class I SAM-dependent methyltransferase [Planctomycetota bacterium]